jgi:hypothetical protein
VFATDNYLFVGMHRTGTTYVRRVLEATFGRNRLPKAQHTPLCRIPKQYRRGRTAVGVVLNPLEWYVSRWNYYWHTAKPQTLRLDFVDYLDAFMFNPHGPIGKACEGFPLAQHQLGAFTYLHVAYFFLGAEALLPDATPEAVARRYSAELSCGEMMRRERLDDDLRRVFGDRVRPHLGKHWRNSIDHRPYQEYYESPRGRKWRRRIAYLDLPIFERYGYRCDE